MKTKLDIFKLRNQKRNSHLYQPGLTEGYDYVVCPISNERLSMIKDNYITNILDIPVSSYPVVQRTCKKRKENISNGLKEFDTVTGLSKYELSQQKSKAILSAVDANGISGYKKKGEKTRSTHMANIDALGRNGYSQIATNAIIVGNATKASRGLITDPSVRTEFYRYKAIITYLTEQHRGTMTRGFVTGLAGTNGAWQIDHMYSILEGYKNKVSPFVIGNIKNLQMIPWRENLTKHSKCSISLTRLFELTGYNALKSESEFYKVIDLINEDMSSGIAVSGARILYKFYESNICS